MKTSLFDKLRFAFFGALGNPFEGHLGTDASTLQKTVSKRTDPLWDSREASKNGAGTGYKKEASKRGFKTVAEDDGTDETEQSPGSCPTTCFVQKVTLEAMDPKTGT